MITEIRVIDITC